MKRTRTTRRIAAVLAALLLSLSLAACGGSSGSASCDRTRSEAVAWAQDFADNTMPNATQQEREALIKSSVQNALSIAGCK